MADAPKPEIIATITLSRPLITHKGEVSQLALRAPTLGDLARCGHPLAVRNGYVPETAEIVLTPIWDMKAVLALLAATSGHDALILEDLIAPDVLKVLNVFFGLLSGQ